VRVRACAVTILAIAACAAVPACSSSQRGSSPGSAPGPAATSFVPAGRPAEVRVDEGDDGRAVTVAVGSQLTVSLASTYWRIAPPVPGGLLRGSPVTVHPATGGRTVPGSGQGTVVETFRALAPGTATVTATRQSCGEAMRCADGLGDYRLTVVVR
jgi:hypothetical protein